VPFDHSITGLSRCFRPGSASMPPGTQLKSGDSCSSGPDDRESPKKSRPTVAMTRIRSSYAGIRWLQYNIEPAQLALPDLDPNT
jgi:hypothetical protein